MTDERSPRRNPDHELKTDRRRPGRVEYANPVLIRMLRGTYDAALHEAELLREAGAARNEETAAPGVAVDEPDDLRAARGIAFTVGVGAVFWLIIGIVTWLLVRFL